MNLQDCYQVEIEIFEADNVTPLDMTAAVNIYAAIYQHPDNILAKYSLNAKDGFTTLPAESTEDLNIGKLYLFLEIADNKKANPDLKTYAEVTVEFTNTNFANNIQRTTATDIELFGLNNTTQVQNKNILQGLI
jgi:hypothetical protein